MIKMSAPLEDDDAEQGSIMLLIIGLGAVLLLLATVIIGITSVYIQQKQLQNLSDQISSAAAQRVSGLGTDSAHPYVQLSNESVQNTVQETLTSSGAHAQFQSLTVGAPTGAADINTAEVTLVARAKIPMISAVLPGGVEITATSSARSELQQ